MNSLIPIDENDATATLTAALRLSSDDLTQLEHRALIRAWWSFLWTYPALHPDDAEVWPEEVSAARPLADEAYSRYRAGQISEKSYYPAAAVRNRLRYDQSAADGGGPTLTWRALKFVLKHAAIIMADDGEAVYWATLPTDTPDMEAIQLIPFDGGQAHIVRQADNPTSVVRGSSVFVIADVAGGEEQQELQLNFYKTWVVEDDLNLSQMK